MDCNTKFSFYSFCLDESVKKYVLTNMKNDELDQRTPSIGYDIKRLKVTMVAMPLILNNPVTGSSYVLCTVSTF